VGIVQLVHTKRASAFSTVRGGDALFPNDFREDLFRIQVCVIECFF